MYSILLYNDDGEITNVVTGFSSRVDAYDYAISCGMDRFEVVPSR